MDSNGTLSGGSAPKGANILEELNSIRTLEKEVKQKMNELTQVDKQLRCVRMVALQIIEKLIIILFFVQRD